MKVILKQLLQWISRALVLPLACGYWLSLLFSSRERAFPGWSQLMSLCPGTSGVYLRHAFYSWILPHCGKDACISFGSLLSHPDSNIGQGVYVGPYCSLGNVTVEDDVLISSYVSIINGTQQHGLERLDVPVRDQPGIWPKIRIGCDTWIGERAVIAADLGRHCVIGAGAVVTEPIPDYGIAVGVPAKVIRYRTSPSESLPSNDPKQSDYSTQSTP